jgi:hypothetical protein
MPRRLLVLNAVLAILCVIFAVGIVRTLLVKHPVPAMTVVCLPMVQEGPA